MSMYICVYIYACIYLDYCQKYSVPQQQQLPIKGFGVVLRSGRCRLRETGALDPDSWDSQPESSFINKLWKSEPAASCRAWLPFGTRSACKGRAGVSKTGTSRHKLKFLASIKDPALFNTSTTSRFCAWTLTRTRSTIPCSSQGCMVIWLIWFQPVWLFNYNIERDLESTSTRIRAVQCSPALGCTL